jgi:hemerythrin
MPEIDAEHKELFALCWQYYAELGIGANRSQLGEIFAEILDQTRSHFAHEEAVLKKAIFPRYVGHQLAHRQILADLVSSQPALGGAKGIADKEAQHVLDALLIHHVREDARTLKEWGR